MGDALLGLIGQLNDLAGEIETHEEGVLLDKVLSAVEAYQKTPGLELHRCSRCQKPANLAEMSEVLEDDWILVCQSCLTKDDLVR